MHTWIRTRTWARTRTGTGTSWGQMPGPLTTPVTQPGAGLHSPSRSPPPCSTGFC